MSDHRALLKHSRNYLVANIATKALLFFSIPVYTRLLSVEEYGIVNVFISTIYVAAVLLTLNSEVAIGRFYFDAKDLEEFKKFVGTSVNLTSCIILLTTLTFLIFANQVADMLSFNYTLTICIVPVALYSIINSVFEQIYNPMLQSKKIAIVTSVKTYLAFALSILFIVLQEQNKYMGYIWGTLLAMLILAVYLYRQIEPYYTFCFNKEHIKYILNYCLPYLPYSLSGVILSQFGRLFLSNESGFEKTGVYSFASNISMIMLVLIGVVHQAWNPYYFRYMNEGDRKSIDTDYDLIWRITLITGLGICFFGQEIGWIMGGSEYWNSLYIVPLLVLGYAFYQWSYVYIRICGYVKKTIWNAVSVISGGIVNVILSYLLIPQFEELGVALAFCLSYFVILLISYLINKFILRGYAPGVCSFIFLLLLSLPFGAVSTYLYFSDIPYPLSVVVKMLLFIVLVVAFLYKYKRVLSSVVIKTRYQS